MKKKVKVVGTRGSGMTTCRALLELTNEIDHEKPKKKKGDKASHQAELVFKQGKKKLVFKFDDEEEPSEE